MTTNVVLIVKDLVVIIAIVHGNMIIAVGVKKNGETKMGYKETVCAKCGEEIEDLSSPDTHTITEKKVIHYFHVECCPCGGEDGTDAA